MSFAEFELRWIDAVMSGFVSDGALAIAEGEVDWRVAALTMFREANPRARLGLRAAVWIAALSPAWMLWRAQTLDEVPPALRSELLERMSVHRLFLVRGLTTILKLNASLALMRVASVRARTHYDARPKRGLPTLQA
jgi:hypothetical protein